ncbi:MAG: DUF4345 domain-containing protein, partial [Nitrospirae bacterium]|nr:DUF4345 domain-containing protein [Nitrospirota bacterium]
MKAQSWSRFYLLFSAAGLFPIALSYGVAPAGVLPAVLDVAIEGTDLTHIFRAVMGLYLAMIVLWILGAFRPELTRAAVISEVVFMFGLAFGRVLSILQLRTDFPEFVFDRCEFTRER